MVDVYLNGRAVVSARGDTLFDYADALRVRVPTSCGRAGQCRECIVEVRGGMEWLTPRTAAEGFLRGGFRLACQAAVVAPGGALGDDATPGAAVAAPADAAAAPAGAVVEFGVLRREPRVLAEGLRRAAVLDPVARRVGDAVVIGGLPLDVYRGRILGLAADVGTTTVALKLVDLETGETAAAAAFENPQRFGGSDVMHRISYDGGEFRGELRQVVLSAINFEVGEMARQAGAHRRQVYAAVLVGNTTMRDIVFGLDVQPVGVRPYKSVAELEWAAGRRGGTALEFEAQAVGLRVFPRARVYGGPLLGGHVGADAAAAALAVGMDALAEPAMLVDIGTNTEVLVGGREGMVAASCPAGPAFEGGGVTYGMAGYAGAVESVRVRQGRAEVTTIGGGAAQGICGSGLVDLLAELRGQGLMNELGAFADGGREFPFAYGEGGGAMTLSRADISALAQAKAANYCGQFIALRHYGRRYGGGAAPVGRLYLAGGFANYLDVGNAVDIGLIAGFPADRVVKAGNAALEGATLMLLSEGERRRAESLARRVEHIELETTPDFFDVFVEGCMFKPMPRDLGG